MPDFTLTLAKPIKSHKGEIGEIKFREPTGGDLIDLGMPYTMRVVGKDSFEMTMIPGAMKGWLERLSGLGWGELGALPARDINKVYGWLTAQFNEAEDDAKNSASPSAS